MSIGIYKVENLINHNKYIGQSIRIEKRWKDEVDDAFDICSHSYDYPLQRAIRKYGIENFSFEILEECKQNELNEQERYWIHYYDTFFNGYNQTLGGDHTNTVPKEKIIGIIKDLEETDLYHREIAEKWQISTEMVQGINTGRYWFDEYRIYPIQTKHKQRFYNTKTYQPKENFCIDCGAPIGLKATRCVACGQKAQRKVERPSKEELFEYLKSINGNFSQASRQYGVSDNAIRKWCRIHGRPDS